MDRETAGEWDHAMKHDKWSPPINRCWTWKAWEKKRPIDQLSCRQLKEGTFWRMSYDYGFGINEFYNAHLVHDERFFKDWRWQMDEAYKIFERKPSLFNAYTNFCTHLPLKK